jgi:serine/threonine protein kinase
MNDYVDIENSKTICQIGDGGFGKIFLCKDKEGKQFVSKQISSEKSFINELAIYSQLVGETDYFPVFYNYYNGDIKKCIFIQNCQQDLRKMLDDDLLVINKEMFVLHMAEALLILKEKKIIHCDLKPENILYDSDRDVFKVCDFGISCFSNSLKKYPVQTLYYRSPEVIMRKNYSYSIDIWSLGCIIFELTNKRILFPYKEEDECFSMMMVWLGMPPKRHFYEFYQNNIKYENDDIILYNCRNIPERVIKENKIKFNKNIFNRIIKGCLMWNPRFRLTPKKIIELFSEVYV